MKKYEEGDKVDKHFLRNCKTIKHYIEESGEIVQIARLKNKIYFTRSTGKCDYKKCDNACCKLFGVDNKQRFNKNFADITIQGMYGKVSFIKKKCKQLRKDGKCKVWNTKNLPLPCKLFPNLEDTYYYVLYNVCSRKIVIEKVYDLTKKCREIHKQND